MLCPLFAEFWSSGPPVAWGEATLCDAPILKGWEAEILPGLNV